MPSFEIPADIFTRLSVFDSPKDSAKPFLSYEGSKTSKGVLRKGSENVVFRLFELPSSTENGVIVDQ